jgi:signal transduction histidine kinase
MRHRAPWIAFGLALAVVLGVMGWVTAKLLEMERERVEGEQRAAVEEQVRLALWRLDSAVPPRLFREMAEVAAAADAPPANAPASPPGVHARLLATPDGKVTCLTEPATDELEALRDALDGADLFARLENPPLPAADDRGAVDRQIEPQETLYSQATQSYRSANEWQARKSQVLDNISTIEQGGLVGKGGKLAQSKQELGLDADLAQEVDGKPATAGEPILGVPQALWIGDRLVLTRIVRRDGLTEVHASWLDWPALAAELQDEIADLLPDARLIPVPSPTTDTARMLATLPVRLDPGMAGVALPPAWSPLRASLVVGWVFVLLATAAVAGLLLWSLSLSERRAAFVSAVTHELRTPLTTFRMYTEMLSEGMVEGRKRDHYVATLRREAERLGHLVENVLSYARIEGGRGRATVETLAAGDIVARVERRLAERCAEAGMELELDVPDDVGAAQVRIDPTAAEQILFNLVDNAAKYAPSEHDPRIVLAVRRAGRHVELRVRDFGPGIPADERRKVFLPFAKSATHAAGTQPGVGLGLALCRRLARQMGGDLRLENAQPGAVFVLALPVS